MSTRGRRRALGIVPTRLTSVPSETADQDRARLRPAADVVSRQLGDGVVLVNLRTNLIYTLNPTGAQLWLLLEDGCDGPELELRMLQAFSEDALRVEIDALVADLLNRGLVTADEAASGG